MSLSAILDRVLSATLISSRSASKVVSRTEKDHSNTGLTLKIEHTECLERDFVAQLGGMVRYRPMLTCFASSSCKISSFVLSSSFSARLMSSNINFKSVVTMAPCSE